MRKKELIEQTTERLMGKLPAEIRQERTIRNHVWYGRWNDLAGFLLTKPSDKAILKRIHYLVDGVNGYRYKHVAWSSDESLDLVIKDLNLK